MNVTLKQPHTHAGVDHPVGAVIDVTEMDATFLMEHGVIDDLPAGKAKVKTTTDAEVK